MNFSVLMSTYKNDNEKYLRESLDSIINQTIKPEEIILIVDGPITEGLNSVIQEYKQKCFFLKVKYLEENMGLGNALRIRGKRMLLRINCQNG